jgi:hypothetical protein
MAAEEAMKRKRHKPRRLWLFERQVKISGRVTPKFAQRMRAKGVRLVAGRLELEVATL